MKSLSPFLSWVLLLLFFLFSTIQAYSQIVNIESRRGNLSDTTGLFGRLGAGVNIIENGNSVLTIHSNIQLELLRPKSDWLLILDYNLVRAGDNSFVDDGFSHLRFNRFISERLVWEAFGQAQYNEKIRILFRGLLGTGPRFALFETEGQSAYLGLAYMYEYEQISDTSIFHRDHRLSSYISFKFKPLKNLTFTGTTYYQPILTDLKSSRLSSKTALQLGITDRLSLGIAYSITFDARLQDEVPDIPNRIYSLRNTLMYKF